MANMQFLIVRGSQVQGHYKYSAVNQTKQLSIVEQHIIELYHTEPSNTQNLHKVSHDYLQEAGDPTPF